MCLALNAYSYVGEVIMFKRIISLLLIVSLLTTTSGIAVDHSLTNKKSSYADREKAVDVLLSSGWTMEEIEDLLT